MYWKHLISIDKSRLISKIYNSQKNLPTNGDWIHLLMKDKEEFGITNTDEEVRKMSKNKFKKIIKNKMKTLAKQYLSKLKNKHSKMKNIKFEEIKCQRYLNDTRLSSSEAKFLFQLRTRMYPVKVNFKNKVRQQGQNLNCEICKIEKDDQKHLLNCHVLKNLVPELKDTKVKYDDIFGNNINKMVKAGKMFHIVNKVRKEILLMTSNNN